MLTFRDVDKVHDLMDDVAVQQEIANEISDAISNPVGFNTDLDEVGYICVWYMFVQYTAIIVLYFLLISFIYNITDILYI